jgi:hypothetical protein
MIIRRIALTCLLCSLSTIVQAQTSPAPPPATTATQPPQDTTSDPIGNVATLTGSATVTRNNVIGTLKLQDDIFKNDILRTGANSTLGITFNDATTFNLTANAQIVVDNFVYAEGGTGNAAMFDIAKGTVAFVAAAVAKNGDMKISTPTASLGIRGTTGLVEVPDGTSPTSARDVGIKLYPDADGRVGHIDVNGRDGARLGTLTQGASGFAIRGGRAGARFTAVPLTISPQQVQRDQGIVRQVHTAQNVGRQIVTQRRNEIRNNPASRNDPARRPSVLRPAPQQRPGLQQQPNLQRTPGQPGTPARPNLQRENLQRQGLQQPGAQQPGLQQGRPSASPLSGRQARPALQRRPALPAPKQKQTKRRF